MFLMNSRSSVMLAAKTHEQQPRSLVRRDNCEIIIQDWSYTLKIVKQTKSNLMITTYMRNQVTRLSIELAG